MRVGGEGYSTKGDGYVGLQGNVCSLWHTYDVIHASYNHTNSTKLRLGYSQPVEHLLYEVTMAPD